MGRKKTAHKEPQEGCGRQGITRRGFLKWVGAGAVVSAAAGTAAAKPSDGPTDPCEMTRVNLRINGRQRRLLVEPRWSLLFVLREKLGLTGTKVGCERGECGACTVLINGQPRYACLTLAVEAAGCQITTAEGLMNGEQLGTVQQAFVEEDAFQCGYCTPGQVVSVEALLRKTPQPTFEQIREGVSGNLCRCRA